MAVRDILKMGDSRLLRIAQPVTAFDSDELHLLITDLLDTMHAADGAGLAAPQIGVDLQLVIFGSDARNPRYPDAPLMKPIAMINPEIIWYSNETCLGEEGCLSVKDTRAQVERAERLTVRYLSQQGEAVEAEYSGFVARIIQHEVDHLNGILFVWR